MKFSSPLIYDLARAVHTSEAVPEDSSMIVAPELHLVATLAEAQPSRRVLENTTIQRTSFRVTIAATQPPGAPLAATRIVTVGRGHWLFSFAIAMVGLSAPAAGFATDAATLGLIDLTDRVILWSAFSVTNVGVQAFFERRFVIPEDGWFFDIGFPSTGAGEQLELSGGIVGSKLL